MKVQRINLYISLAAKLHHMLKKFFCFTVFLFFILPVTNAQLSEDFSDGNFTGDPEWISNASDFIINDNLQLQSNNILANSTFYISTSNTLATQTEWSFWIQMAFNPSSVNYIEAYLIASASDLTLETTSGYFVRMGGTDDEISLFKKNSSGTIIKLIQGTKQALNKSNNTLKIKVTRDENNLWTLLTDLSGTGNHFNTEGSITDNTFTTASYFGFLIKQSTSGFFSKHFFDDIEIRTFIPDQIPPAIVSATAVANHSVDILFNEPLDKASSENLANYFVSHGIGLPEAANLNAQNKALVHLAFSQPFANGLAYSMIIEGIEDLSGNAIKNGAAQFSYYAPQRYDVVISEVFPDPSPQVGLPPFKFLELKNVSPHPINLAGWTIMNGNNQAVLPLYQLLPDSYVLVTALNSTSAFEKYGPVLGVSNFPSMNIGGSTLVLKTATGNLMHAMQYELATYKNELKKEGGWSLEMIDTKNPCAGASNWTSSKDPSGGTPGKKNSVDSKINDETAPILLHAFPNNEKSLTLFFNKPLDSLKASNTGNYTLDFGPAPLSIEVLPPFFDKVVIQLNSPLDTLKQYTISVKSITDCSGNVIAEQNKTRFGLAHPAESRDIIVNEILFNPPPMGVDYVELYNRSDKNIDLSKLYLANRNSSNTVSSIQQISVENKLLFPGEFILLSADPEIVKSQFITTNPKSFIKVNPFPSYPNTTGNVIVLNHQGEIIDEVKYSEKWHFALLKNAQGVALERIDYNGESIASNFHSAAASAGYGTPGYKNSQYLVAEEIQGEISVRPEIFSPDNDGIDDLVTLHYSFPTPGYVANVTIFDASGRPVRYLQRNSLSGIKGHFRWDGLDDKSRKLPQGIYLIYTEVFNAQGKKKIFKNSVVLARKVQ